MAVTILLKLSLLFTILSQGIQAQGHPDPESQPLFDKTNLNNGSESRINLENNKNDLEIMFTKLPKLADANIVAINDTLRKTPFTSTTVMIIRYTHAVFMVAVWGFGLDLAIMVARYDKAYVNYTILHGNLMIVIIILTALSEIFLIIVGFLQGDWNVNGIAISHLVVGIAILVVLTLQAVLGFFVRKKISSTTYMKYIRGMTISHRVLGYSILILGRAEMIIGCYIMGWIELAVLLILLAPITGYWIVKERRHRLQRVGKREPLENNKVALTSKQEKLVTLLNTLYGSNEKLNDISAVAAILEDPKYGVKDLFWVLLDNKIFDLTHFNHPGGNFIIKAVKGREIGRFFYGAYGVEIYDYVSHTHSTKAFYLLQKMCIGDLKTVINVVIPYNVGGASDVSENDHRSSPRGVREEDDDDEERPISSGQIAKDKELDSALYKFLIEKETRIRYYWTLKSRDPVEKNLLKFSFESFGRYRINQSYQSITQFGKHFKISHRSHPKWRLYTMLLCQTPQNVHLRKHFLEYFERTMHGVYSFAFNPKWSKVGSSLVFIIKKYDNKGAFSKFLYEETYVGKDDFAVSGPYGFGLELFQELKGHYVIFCAGTGILPFLDLFDLLLRKAICDIIADRIGPANAEPLYPFCNAADAINPDFRISLFASFEQGEDFIAKDIIEPLSDISSTYQLNLFSCYLSSGNSSIINTSVGGNIRFNQDFIANHLDLHAERVYICGPPKFNHLLPQFVKNLNIDPNKIFLV